MNSGSKSILYGREIFPIQWWTEKPGILQSMGLQRVRHDWVTELNWIEMDFAERATDWVQLQIQQEKVGFIFKEQDGDQ